MEHIKNDHSAMYEEIKTAKEISSDNQAKLKDITVEFVSRFQ